ncbi:MAG: ABC transporter substrate-binding protein, partial [Saccharofermentanales bacterium]
ESLNPLISIQYQWNRMTYLFYESLYSVDINQRAVPVLALDHQVSADALRHTVRIRPDITFHDGKILDSHDIAATVAFIQASGSLIYKDKLKNIRFAAAVDNSTIAFTLIEPDPFFEYKLCFPVLSAVALSDEKTTIFPGTGPYQIDGYDATKGMTSSIYVKYRDSSHYRIKRIAISLYDDSRAAMEAFGSDKTDVILLNDELYETYYLRNDLTMVRFPGSTFMFFQLNQKDGSLLSDVAKAAYLKSALSEQSIYDGISELLCSPESFPFSKTSGIIHETRCTHRIDFSDAKNTFVTKEDVLSVYYNADDLIETRIAANLEKILKKKSVQYKLYPSDQPGLDAVLTDGMYDVIIRQAVIRDDPDPSWLYLSGLHPEFTNSATLDTATPGFAAAAGSLDMLYHAPGTVASEGDLCESMYQMLQEGPFYGIGYRINAAVLSKRINGTIQSNAFNQYNRIEEMWVWSGQ